MKAAVFFARRDSIYKNIDQLDVFDIDRDARNFAGPVPVIAHPPRRAWGRLRGLAKPRDDEKALGLFAVDMVRKFGGVLEHPEASSLWAAAGMPRPDAERITFDEFGGWTFPIAQQWFGHRAEKKNMAVYRRCAAGGYPCIPYGAWRGLARHLDKFKNSEKSPPARSEKSRTRAYAA